MSKKVLVQFEPLEPYFLGGEKNFSHTDTNKKSQQQTGSYYIDSRAWPSQSTLFGVIRYMGIPNRRDNCRYDEDEIQEIASQIGRSAFSLDPEGSRDFRNIHSMSPLFLMRGDEPFFPAPRNNQNIRQYIPFAQYQDVPTNLNLKDAQEGQIDQGTNIKRLPRDFDAKAGICEGFVNRWGEIIPAAEIFGADERVGINRKSDRDGFFKKNFKTLKRDWRFCVQVDMDDSFELSSMPVSMGKGRGSFAATVSHETLELDAHIRQFLRANACLTAYAASDLYVPGSIYDSCYFASTATTEHRGFSTVLTSGKKGIHVKKDDVLHTFLRAGSVFLVRDRTAFEKNIKKPNIEMFGMNHVVFGGVGE